MTTFCCHPPLADSASCVPPVPGRHAPRSMEKINVVQFPAGQLNCITFALLPSNSKILEEIPIMGKCLLVIVKPIVFLSHAEARRTQRPCGDASRPLAPMRHVGLEASAWDAGRRVPAPPSPRRHLCPARALAVGFAVASGDLPSGLRPSAHAPSHT